LALEYWANDEDNSKNSCLALKLMIVASVLDLYRQLIALDLRPSVLTLHYLYIYIYIYICDWKLMGLMFMPIMLRITHISIRNPLKNGGMVIAL